MTTLEHALEGQLVPLAHPGITMDLIRSLLEKPHRVARGSDREVYISEYYDFVVKFCPRSTTQNFSEVRCWELQSAIKKLRLAPVYAYTLDFRILVMKKCKIGADPPLPYTLLDLGQAGQDETGQFVSYDYGTLLPLLDNLSYATVFGYKR